ncbi:hypothetical protein BH11BAC5_BH11BAC5_41280 [soil metagenome]|jgi:hypothetical protein
MQSILVIHNLLRWAVVLFGVWTLINGLTGYFGKRSFTANDNRSNLFFMISCDIQLLIGLILYFNNGWFARLKDLGNNMKDPYTRFFTMEHLTMMLIAWVLVHVGRATVKKAGTDAAKHKKMLIFFGLAIVLILASIPWPFREAITRPLFRTS